MAIPSPVLIAPLVVNGNAFPAPPVQMITDLPSTARTVPVRNSIAAHPRHRPSSSSSSFVAKCSS